MMHAVVAGGLVDLLRSLPVTLSGHPIDLPWSCVVRLESLLAYIGEHDLHVVLLDNIAYINRTDDYERGPIATNAP